MGVHGLWDLLAPVGRRVSVETLAGKRLAIDASIWMIQFMKAMRDENGEMVRNAHLLGFFRRICKLLFLRTKPVFVFDGGTPALKRRTVIARRRHRENAQAKIRKTAEKLLLNQFKQMRLKELAEELERQRTNSVTKGKKVITDDDVQNPSQSTCVDDKEFATDEAVMGPKMSGGNVKYYDGLGQEELDEMLAASLLAEEEGFTAGESSSGAYVQDQDEDAYEDEELILPTMNTKVDPAVLAALPPSMQLDLLVQMRERLMAENRQKYQKVKKVPSRFSELQIESYLKTVAFRREIDEVQKTAAGRGISGVQTSRIASEANREFIFSSSFSGDKEVLTSAGQGRGSADHLSAPIANSSKQNANNGALGKGKTAAVSTEAEPQGGYENDVETYLDERGRFRVSRVRAMGIRMTRDLQRNLDLMKEIEEERLVTSNILEMEPSVGLKAIDALGQGAEKTQLMDSSILDTGEMASGSNKDGEVLLTAGNALEISFEDNDQHESGVDDDLFASLVAGDPVIGFSVGNSSPKKQASDDASEMEWVEGNNLRDSIEVDGISRFTNDGVADDKELEWEEGSFDIKQSDSPYSVECKENISKGDIEEQADFQEAIRRSLQDVIVQKSEIASCPGLQCRASTKTASQSTISGFLHKEDLTEIEGQLEVDLQDAESRFQVLEKGKRLGTTGKQSILRAHSFLEMQSALSLGGSSVETEIVTEKDCQSSPKLDLSIQGTSTMGTKEAGTPIESLGTRVYQSIDQLMNTSSSKDDGIVSNSNASPNTDLIFERLTDDLAPQKSHASVGSPDKTAVEGTSSMRNAMNETDFGKESANEVSSIHSSAEREKPLGDLDFLGGQEEENQVMKARLEEEMLLLGQQQLELGDEQKRLERNADSVSNEMFAEAQELLQMFGLPYIVAPMEAEAQCAFMELTNLVDGVVTDDSDAFLFGARSVYKNIFDNRKYVETYFMKDIEHELGLNRDKLIRMALLLGSDYTEGVSGIGIVNAIEVVNAFPEEDGLCKFREWIESPDPSILGKFEKQAGGETRKTQSKVGDLGMSDSNSNQGVSSTNRNIAESGDEIHSVKQTFMDKHRNVSKNWHIPSTFPSDAVISAYASPQVDKATEPFSWGKPDLLLLRKLCWEKFGWNSQKASELLLPVLKEYDKRETQLRLEAFYTFNERFAKIRSKRIKKAVKGIAGAKSSSLMDDSLKDGHGSRKGRRVNQSDLEVVGPQKRSKRRKLQDAQVIASNTANVDESKSKVSRGKRGLSARDGRSQNRNKGDECGGRGKGSRTKQSDSSNRAGFSSDDGSSAESGQEQCGSEKQHQVRRSQRVRKEVKYAMNESEDGDSDQENSQSCDENAVRDDVLGELPVIEDMNTVPSETNNPQVNEQETYAGWSSSLCADVQESETREFQSDGFPSDIHSSEDYLAMGGGFCVDEDELASDSTGVTPGANDPSRGSLSDKCVDENNVADQYQSSVCPSEMINVAVNGKSTGDVDTSDAKERLKKAGNENERSGPTILERTACIDDPIDVPPRSLRALPSLRKKRKT